jgi:hypothetical protein
MAMEPHYGGINPDRNDRSGVSIGFQHGINVFRPEDSVKCRNRMAARTGPLGRQVSQLDSDSQVTTPAIIRYTGESLRSKAASCQLKLETLRPEHPRQRL